MKGDDDDKSAYQKMVESEADLVLSQEGLSCILVPNGRDNFNRVFLEPISRPIGFTRIDFDQVRSLSYSGGSHSKTLYIVLRNGKDIETFVHDFEILARFGDWLQQHKTMPDATDSELAGIYLIERRECYRHLWIGFEDIYTFSFSETDTGGVPCHIHDEPHYKTVKSGQICDACAKLTRGQMIRCKHVVEGFLLVQLTDATATKVCLRTTQKQAVAIHARYVRWITQNRTFVIEKQDRDTQRFYYDVGLTRLVYDSAQMENDAKNKRKKTGDSRLQHLVFDWL